MRRDHARFGRPCARTLSVVPSFETFADRVETLEKAHKAEQIASDTIEKAYRPAEFTAPLVRAARQARPSHLRRLAHRLENSCRRVRVRFSRSRRPLAPRHQGHVGTPAREPSARSRHGSGRRFRPREGRGRLVARLLEGIRGTPVAAELAEVARKSAKWAIQSIEHINSRNAVAKKSDKAVGAWAKDRAAELVGRQRTRSGRLAHDPDAFANHWFDPPHDPARADSGQVGWFVGNRVAMGGDPQLRGVHRKACGLDRQDGTDDRA